MGLRGKLSLTVSSEGRRTATLSAIGKEERGERVHRTESDSFFFNRYRGAGKWATSVTRNLKKERRRGKERDYPMPVRGKQKGKQCGFVKNGKKRLSPEWEGRVGINAGIRGGAGGSLKKSGRLSCHAF